MKRLAILGGLLLAACSSAPETPVRPPGPTDGDLQPLERGYTWEYVSNGVRQTRRVVGDGKVGRFDCKVVEWRTGNVVEKQWLRPEPDGLKLYRTQEPERTRDLPDPALLVKYPGKPGDLWTYEEHHPGFSLEVSGAYERDEQVVVPAGTYTAARVRLVKALQGLNVVDQTSWYVRGTGLVKLELKSMHHGQETRVAMELVSFQR